MRISFISPPTNFLEYTGFPPIPLLYLNSFIKENGYNDAKIIDLNVTDKIPESDVYVITATTPQFPYALDLLEYIKKINPYAVSIIGGAHASADPNSCHQFDKVVVGDGEFAILKCLRDIEIKEKKNVDLERHIYIGKQIPNIDKLPMPDRKSVNDNYKYYINDQPSTFQLTSRGCPYNCHFCQNGSKTNRIVRFHSNEYVIKEIENIKYCDYRGIYFMDDMFTLRKDLLQLKSSLKDMTWQCQIRGDENLNNIKILGKLNCYQTSIGLESGSQQILDKVNKQLNLNKIFEIVKVCKEQNIKVHPYIILGLPGENHETVKETLDILRSIEPDSVGISTFVPYPGTYIYNNIEKFDIKIEDNDYKNWHFKGGNVGYNCVVSTSHLTSKEILEYRDIIDKEFN